MASPLQTYLHNAEYLGCIVIPLRSPREAGILSSSVRWFPKVLIFFRCSLRSKTFGFHLFKMLAGVYEQNMFGILSLFLQDQNTSWILFRKGACQYGIEVILFLYQY
jgi:hypothetical protein